MKTLNKTPNLNIIFKNIFTIKLKYFLGYIMTGLFPIKCLFCRAENKHLCQSCQQALTLNKKVTSYDTRSFAKYNYQDSKVRKILFRIKYYNHPALAIEMGDYSREFITGRINSFEDFILIPIPISAHRLKERSYNQAEKISLGIDEELTFNILKREKSTTKLKSATSIDDRKNELENSMSVDTDILNKYLDSKLNNTNFDNPIDKSEDNNSKKNNLKNIKVLLIDDITTSGSTYYEARRALAAYGFEVDNIYFFALAH